MTHITIGIVCVAAAGFLGYLKIRSALDRKTGRKEERANQNEKANDVLISKEERSKKVNQKLNAIDALDSDAQMALHQQQVEEMRRRGGL
jgi:Flp pilus assembly protein CpaB